MKLSTLFIYVFMLSLVPSAAFAQEDNGTNHASFEKFLEVSDACDKEYANTKLDPVRGKISIHGSSTTDEMLKNENKPSKAEREALRAYINTRITCTKLFVAIAHPNDEKGRRAADIQSEKDIATEIKPLINGKITYVEYNRLQYQRSKDVDAIMKKVE